MFHWLSHFSHYHVIFNLFRYITFRSIAVLLTAFFSVFFATPWFIQWMRTRRKEGQPIRLDGPPSHLLTKKGTPTMGGILIVGSTVGSVLLWGDLMNPYLWLMLGILIGYGAIGGIDDALKLSKRTSHGLSARTKLFLQCGLAIIPIYAVMSLHPEPLKARLLVPFFKEVMIPLGGLYSIFGLFVLLGTSNAVNLTDGLDGLAIGPLMISLGILAIFAYVTGHHGFATYLQLPYLPHTGELTIMCCALIGSGLGFLWYNAPPAKIFMGDIGSLSLGGVLGLMSLAIKQEILLALVGGIFVLEALSVIIQVAYFKKTGKRLFFMAPLHHHFEKKGWAETTIVFRFWIISGLLGLIALATLKLR